MDEIMDDKVDEFKYNFDIFMISCYIIDILD